MKDKKDDKSFSFNVTNTIYMIITLKTFKREDSSSRRIRLKFSKMLKIINLNVLNKFAISVL